MKIKFNDVQLHQIKTAHDNAASVLRDVKNRKLKARELEAMKALEVAVQNLEVLSITGK